LLAFVRTAHYWTKLHPELAFEDDISHLLVTHETLAQCILKDPEAQKDSLGWQVAAELTSLRERQRQHESMTGRLLQTQEEERKRISRALHDDLSQKVALLAFDTSNLVLATPSSREELTKSLSNLQIRTAGLATDIRKIAHQLHPSILDDIGLGAALRELCHEFSEREAFEVVFEEKTLLKGNLPMDVASCLYRVAQEALHNVVKHAQASQVWLTVSGSPDKVFLCIRDNGVGFDSEATASRHGLGVISMEERARLVQGDLCIQSQPGQGTTLIVSVPLPRSRNEAPASTTSG
jgi:signal transduction histidine kinase